MANINQIGIPGLDNGFLQPKLQNHWRISFINAGATGHTSPNKLSMQAISCTRPTQTFDTIEMSRFNTKVLLAAKHTWEPITIVVEDDIKSTASKIIQNQINKQAHFAGGAGAFLKRDFSGSPYMFAMDIVMLNGGETPLEQWALEGCWFSSVNYGELDYSSNDTVKITITLNYAHAKQIFYTVPDSDKAEGHYVFNLDGLFNSAPVARNPRQIPGTPINNGKVVLVNEPVPEISTATLKLIRPSMLTEANSFVAVSPTVNGNSVLPLAVYNELRDNNSPFLIGVTAETKSMNEMNSYWNPSDAPAQWPASFTDPVSGTILSISNPPSPDNITTLEKYGLTTEVDVNGFIRVIEA